MKKETKKRKNKLLLFFRKNPVFVFLTKNEKSQVWSFGFFVRLLKNEWSSEKTWHCWRCYRAFSKLGLNSDKFLGKDIGLPTYVQSFGLATYTIFFFIFLRSWWCHTFSIGHIWFSLVWSDYDLQDYNCLLSRFLPKKFQLLLPTVLFKP